MKFGFALLPLLLTNISATTLDKGNPSCDCQNKFGEKILYWQEACFDWQHFQRKSRPNESFGIASTHTNVGIYPESKSSSGFAVFVYFDCNKSYSNPYYRNTAILAHEKLHFDITELYGRRMHQSLLRASNSKGKALNTNEAERIEATIRKEWDQFQDLYDAETNFSINKAEQLQWQSKMDSLLKSTPSYPRFDN